jgi:uncharacterized membrane protein YsdA (DUF1294 family)
MMLFYFLLAYFVWAAALSLLTFVLFGWDKRQAGASGRRVSESTLLGFSTLGGWPGTLCAIRLFRHKTQKQPFRFRLHMGITLHVLGVLVLFYMLRLVQG